MKEPTKADLAAAVAKLTQENAQLRDLLAAISLAAGTVPVSKGNDYLGEWKRSTKVLANIKVLSRLGDGHSDWDGYLAYAAGELQAIAAEPAGYEVYQPEGAELHAEPEAAAGADGWCPASTVTDDDETLHCDRDRGHGGSHHAGPLDDGAEVAWSDEPDICESTYLAPGVDYYCSLDAGHPGLHSQLTSAGAFIAEWGYPDGHVHTTSGHEPAAVAS